MTIRRKASAQWEGGLKDGTGTLTTQSGALDGLPYSFGRRFGDEPGTNPEELIGAAHAGCFTMALSKTLEDAGHKPAMLRTEAEISLEKGDAGFSITASRLTLTARVPGIDAATFLELAEQAKEGCPVSRLLDAEIALEAKLEG